jgi:putative transposase
VLAVGEYYHIYNRGNSKQDIFLDTQDYIVFQQFLYLMNMEKRITSREIGHSTYSYERDEPLVSIGAYCLMSNHIHILLKQEKEKGISKFMQKLSTAYAMYFNKKYTRTGGLFEGAFKSKWVGGDVYLKYLYSYIHFNPMKMKSPSWKEDIKIGKKINTGFTLEYPFSSILDYLGVIRNENAILNKNAFPLYFSGREDFFERHDPLV